MKKAAAKKTLGLTLGMVVLYKSNGGQPRHGLVQAVHDVVQVARLPILHQVQYSDILEEGDDVTVLGYLDKYTMLGPDSWAFKVGQEVAVMAAEGFFVGSVSYRFVATKGGCTYAIQHKDGTMLWNVPEGSLSEHQAATL